MEVAERNMWVIEIKYVEYSRKFYYFYEHLELKMILSAKYLDNLRPFTKQVKNDKENQWKKFEADVCHPEHLLVYYNFLKNVFLWRT